MESDQLATDPANPRRRRLNRQTALWAALAGGLLVLALLIAGVIARPASGRLRAAARGCSSATSSRAARRVGAGDLLELSPRARVVRPLRLACVLDRPPGGHRHAGSARSPGSCLLPRVALAEQLEQPVRLRPAPELEVASVEQTSVTLSLAEQLLNARERLADVDLRLLLGSAHQPGHQITTNDVLSDPAEPQVIRIGQRPSVFLVPTFHVHEMRAPRFG
jgi:hypothetical protein